MALIAYMSVHGLHSGAIKGDCTQADERKDTIVVYASEHLMETPTDPLTGQPAGGVISHEFTVAKHKDMSSPLLFGMCCKGERGKVALDFYRMTPDGREEKFFSVNMENALVCKMREYTPATFLEGNKPFHDMEEVSFSFAKIKWGHVAGHVEFAYTVPTRG